MNKGDIVKAKVNSKILTGKVVVINRDIKTFDMELPNGAWIKNISFDLLIDEK